MCLTVSEVLENIRLGEEREPKEVFDFFAATSNHRSCWVLSRRGWQPKSIGVVVPSPRHSIVTAFLTSSMTHKCHRGAGESLVSVRG